ncbi:hypothetical protein V4R14_04965 [Listeria monocytogenes]
MFTEIEQLYIDYIEANKSFITKFHKVYYELYKQKLNGYSLKDYMVTSAIQMNKLKGYNDYEEFYNMYLEALGNDDITYGEELHIYYYDTFLLNMDDEIQKLKKQFNKDDDDIYSAYIIKTVWNFYVGFVIEKRIRSTINKETDIMLLERGETEQRLIDNTMAIDIEATTIATNTIGLQIKSYTYLNIDSDKKDKHIEKQNKYKSKYNAEVYYILYEDYLPIYKSNTTNQSYLFTQSEVKKLTKADTTKGTYEGLANDLKRQLFGSQLNDLCI